MGGGSRNTVNDGQGVRGKRAVHEMRCQRWQRMIKEVNSTGKSARRERLTLTTRELWLRGTAMEDWESGISRDTRGVYVDRTGISSQSISSSLSSLKAAAWLFERGELVPACILDGKRAFEVL